MVPQGWNLTYLYVGTDDLEEDLAYYTGVFGARKAWHFQDQDHGLVGLSMPEGPEFLLADHRPTDSCVPLFSVPHLDTTTAELVEHGWHPETEPFPLPPGPCRLFEDPDGNTFGIFENVRPTAMEVAYADPAEHRAVRREPGS